VDLSKLEGKLTIIHFWATWCPPCVEEVPALSRFWEQYGKRGDIALYAISWTRTGRRSTPSTRRTRTGLPLYIDNGAAAAKRFGTIQYPEDLHRESQRARRSSACPARCPGTTPRCGSGSSSCWPPDRVIPSDSEGSEIGSL
jgi:peroxiredoxin